MNWEKIKMTEGQKSVLEGVPASLPSLLKAQRMQEKASKVGFDWNNKTDIWSKVEEEFSELKFEVLSGNKAGMEEELGDMIFSLVNMARFEGIVAEDALQRTNSKFKQRFQYIESQGGDLNKLTLEEMDILWDEAKKLERM
jgi:XTP/dITP diphosphohydrolase